MRNPAEESTEGKKCNISVIALLTGFPAIVGAMSYASFRGRDMRMRMRSRQDGWEETFSQNRVLENVIPEKEHESLSILMGRQSR